MSITIPGIPPEFGLPLLQSAILPTTIALPIFALAWLKAGRAPEGVIWREQQANEAGTRLLAGPLAIGLATIMSYAWTFYKPDTGFKIASAEMWMVPIALIAAITGLVSALLPRGLWPAWAVRSVLRAGLLGVLCWFCFVASGDWRMPGAFDFGMIAVFAVAGSALWGGLDLNLAKTRGIPAALLIIITATVYSFALVPTGNAKMSQCAGAIAAAAGGAAMVALLRPGLALAASGAIPAILITTLCYQGFRYGNYDGWLWLGALLPIAGLLFWGFKSKAWPERLLGIAVRLGLIAALGGVMIGLFVLAMAARGGPGE